MTRAFVELADTLVDDYDIIDLLDRLVAHCIELISTKAAGILLADARGELRVVASSNEDAQLMELLQLQLQPRTLPGLFPHRGRGVCSGPCRVRRPVAALRPGRSAARRVPFGARPAPAAAR